MIMVTWIPQISEVAMQKASAWLRICVIVGATSLEYQ